MQKPTVVALLRQFRVWSLTKKSGTLDRWKRCWIKGCVLQRVSARSDFLAATQFPLLTPPKIGKFFLKADVHLSVFFKRDFVPIS